MIEFVKESLMSANSFITHKLQQQFLATNMQYFMINFHTLMVISCDYYAFISNESHLGTGETWVKYRVFTSVLSSQCRRTVCFCLGTKPAVMIVHTPTSILVSLLHGFAHTKF